MRKCIMLLPEIEKRGIWKKRGFGSIYEYAAKIAGMSRNNVNEALRVFEKIADKPALQKIMALRGINAVKPVVTIATAETAAFWAEKAGEMSKNTLETYVREVRSGRLNECHSIQVRHQAKPDRESLQTVKALRDPQSGACLPAGRRSPEATFPLRMTA